MSKTLDLVRAEFAKYPTGAEATRVALCIGRDVQQVRNAITRLLNEGWLVRASMRKVKFARRGAAVASYMLVDPETREAIRNARAVARPTAPNEDRMPEETTHCAAMLAKLMGALRYEDSADSVGKEGGRNFLRYAPAPTLERGAAMGPWQ